MTDATQPEPDSDELSDELCDNPDCVCYGLAEPEPELPEVPDA
ncbi:hypothetical protein [Actinomadura madurae]|nr:hypothetical protein [Actinomadura madurae]